MVKERSRMEEVRVPIALVLLAMILAGWLLATGNEISVWADFRRDVSVRDGYELDQINDIRFYDSAPYSIWLPSDVFVWESLRRGEFPLWDRSQAGGYSPLLNLQNGVMHPLRWATVVVPREFASSALVIEALLALALGTFLMLRGSFGCSEPAALTGSLVVVLSGYVLSTIHFSGVVLPLVHVPWLVHAHESWAVNRGTRAAACLAAVVALLALSGHPMMIVVALMVAGALVVWRALAWQRARRLLPAAAIAFLGFLMTAFATLPMLLNVGGLWSYKNTTAEGMSYALVARTGFADALGGLLTYVSYEGDFIDGGPLVFHLGIAASLLAMVGVVVAARARATMIVAVMVLVGWLLAAPPQLVVDLVSRTPLGYFKPWYLMFLFVFPAAIAVGLGLDRCLTLVPTRYRGAAVAVAVALVVIPGLRPVADVLRPRPMQDVSSPAVRFLEDVVEPFRVVGLRGQTHAPNVGALTGIEDVRLSSPVHPKRYHDWYVAAAGDRSRSFPTIATFDDADSPLLGAFNTRFLLRGKVPGHDIQSFLPRVGDHPSRGYGVDPRPDGDRYRLALDSRSVEIWEARHAHARAHFAGELLVVGSREDALRSLSQLRGDTTMEIVETSDPTSLLKVEPAAEGDAVRIDYPSSRRVTVDVKASGPRLLVLHDSWARGWRATIDGRPAEVLPASVLSRAVVVPAGEHRIEMRFVPRGMWIGMVVSLAAIALLPLVASRARLMAEAQ